MEQNRAYGRLTLSDRDYIARARERGDSVRKIARDLERSPSTISRELKHNAAKQGYRSKPAQARADKRKHRRLPSRYSDGQWEVVKALLSLGMSPEQASGWLRSQELPLPEPERIAWPSHVAIYERAKADPDLRRCMRKSKKYRKRSGPERDRRGEIPNRKGISERPPEVAERIRFGDFEVDLISGRAHQGFIVVVLERRSRYADARVVPDKSSATVSAAVVEMLERFRGRWPEPTITSDNGREFAGHEGVAGETGFDWFFAKPYASHQRGAVENYNRLLRRDFPSWMNFREDVAQRDVDRSVEKWNNFPRKCLGMKTPNQVLFGIDPDFGLERFGDLVASGRRTGRRSTRAAAAN